MKIRETVAASTGSTLLLIGVAATVIYSLISYNVKSIEWAGLLLGIGVTTIGLMLIKYGAKTTLRGALFVLMDLWP